MKLLIITQKVDKEDPILGFFHDWICKLSPGFEFIHVICLGKGKFNLPQNVAVHSLGEELEFSIFNFQFSILKKIKYIFKFFHLCFFSSLNYDAIFVHMNQEYILLGGFVWKILRKKIYFWRNHRYGNLLTIFAVWLSGKVFCTSRFAFVAKYKKTCLMPVGIDTNVFNTESRIKNYELCKNKILFLGRMAPVKRPDLLVDALDILNKKGTNFVCDFYGDPLFRDKNFYISLSEKVQKLNLIGKVNFYPAVPNDGTPEIYNKYEIFVNLTPTGSFDKTILEAAACGCLLVVANKTLSGEIDGRMMAEKETPEDIAQKINFWLERNDAEKEEASVKLQKYVLKKHSLNILIDKLSRLITV